MPMRDGAERPELSGEWPTIRCDCGYSGLTLGGACPRCGTLHALPIEREGIEGLPEEAPSCRCWIHRATWREVAFMAGIAALILLTAAAMAVWGR